MDPHPSDSLFELQVDNTSANYFREATRWAKFLAIVFLIGIGCMLLVLLGLADTFEEIYGEMLTGIQGAPGLIIGVIIFFLLLFIFPTILLLRFATFTKSGVDRQDQAVMNKGLASLKNYLLVMGILTIIGVLFSFFSILWKLF